MTTVDSNTLTFPLVILWSKLLAFKSTRRLHGEPVLAGRSPKRRTCACGGPCLRHPGPAGRSRTPWEPRESASCPCWAEPAPTGGLRRSHAHSAMRLSTASSSASTAEHVLAGGPEPSALGRRGLQGEASASASLRPALRSRRSAPEEGTTPRSLRRSSWGSCGATDLRYPAPGTVGEGQQGHVMPVPHHQRAQSNSSWSSSVPQSSSTLKFSLLFS